MSAPLLRWWRTMVNFFMVGSEMVRWELSAAGQRLRLPLSSPFRSDLRRPAGRYRHRRRIAERSGVDGAARTRRRGVAQTVTIRRTGGTGGQAAGQERCDGIPRSPGTARSLRIGEPLNDA